MLKHVVMWKLREHAEGQGRAENARRMKVALESLRAESPGCCI
ncbi:MAG TPA: hypothetical protein VFE30_13635 [Anaeromyxobacteraceae bacterium]|jgi:hypothetical protein|nr:hypothetical protein [Anaeromyxobacteraceae bacterium]